MHSATTTDRDYVSALSAANRFLQAWQTQDHEAGLLLLTDDGDLAFRLTHPSYKVFKEYIVVVGGRVPKAKLEELRNGVVLDDGDADGAGGRVVCGF